MSTITITTTTTSLQNQEYTYTVYKMPYYYNRCVALRCVALSSCAVIIIVLFYCSVLLLLLLLLLLLICREKKNKHKKGLLCLLRHRSSIIDHRSSIIDHRSSTDRPIRPALVHHERKKRITESQRRTTKCMNQSITSRNTYCNSRLQVHKNSRFYIHREAGMLAFSYSISSYCTD
jgi:hypothetical protein